MKEEEEDVEVVEMQLLSSPCNKTFIISLSSYQLVNLY